MIARQYIPGALILLGFVMLLILAIRWWQMAGSSSDAFMPPELIELTGRFRTVAVSTFVIAVTGCFAAIGILQGRRWAWFLLASLLSFTSVALLAVRLSLSPKYVTDPDWGLALAVAIGAAASWRHIFRTPPKTPL